MKKLALENTNIECGNVLWKNNSPNTGIGTMRIKLSSDDYDILTIVHKRSITQSIVYSTTFLKGTSTKIIDVSTSSSGSPWINNRQLNYIDDLTYDLTVSEGQRTNSTTITYSNDNNIPLFIIGYKIKLN